MCSERDLKAVLREGPVDRQGVCYCSVPESVQVILRKVQILSFDDRKGVGYAANKITTYRPSDHTSKAA
jgi:hypothetical protein